VSLISRYVFRETMGAWLVVMAVLFVILMTDRFADILGEAVADELPREAVLGVLGLSALQYITVLTPMSVFLGAMLALARLNRDGEMAALIACGIGPLQFLRPMLALVIALAALLSWLALVRTPDALREIEQIRREARASLELGVIEPGVFTTPDQGLTTLYAREVVADEMRDVFVHRRTGDLDTVVLADYARRILDPHHNRLTFVLSDGWRYEGTPGEASFRVMSFREHGIPVPITSGADEPPPVETLPTRALLGSSLPEERAELQWRLSGPISLFVLVVLAVPLSRSRPREGRYARVGFGLLLYITYVNMLSVARVWVEASSVPNWLGMWWVHGLAALLGLWLLGRESGWFVRAPIVHRVAAA
jgi:lipopolysaccharide export system permease protein